MTYQTHRLACRWCRSLCCIAPVNNASDCRAGPVDEHGWLPQGVAVRHRLLWSGLPHSGADRHHRDPDRGAPVSGWPFMSERTITCVICCLCVCIWQWKTVRPPARPCGRLLVVAGLQHIAARLLAELAVPQNAAPGESGAGGHPGHRQQCECGMRSKESVVPYKPWPKLVPSTL